MITDKLNVPIRINLEDSQIFEGLSPNQRVMFEGEDFSWRHTGGEKDTYCFAAVSGNKLKVRGVDIIKGSIVIGYDSEVDCTPDIVKEYSRYSLQTGQYTSSHGTIRNIAGVAQ